MSGLRVALFISRNKDNKDLPGFKERSHSFLTTKGAAELVDEFKRFQSQGVSGETSRMYLHVNSRDNDKIRKELLHWLIEHEDVSMAAMPQRIASIASKKECQAENKWLFDFDDDPHLINDFVNDVRKFVPSDVVVEPHQTPNGFAVIVGRGFDTRELLAKWEHVVLKRDGMLCVDWGTRGEIHD